MGGAAAIGNFLDLPGSVVRDVIAGESAWDQFLTPFTAENRVTGRDLLRDMDAIGKKDTWQNWIGGVGTEIVLDPLTYMTFGASALGKGGQILKNAGVLDDLLKRAAPEVGRRVGRQTTKVQDLFNQAELLQKAGDASYMEKIEKAARAVGLDSAPDFAQRHGTEELGGLLGLGVPFKAPSAVLGKGKGAQAAAKVMDVTGKTIRESGVGRLTASLFAKENLDAITIKGQEIAKTVSRMWREADAAARETLSGAVRDVARVGAWDNVDDMKAIVRALEDVEALPDDLVMRAAKPGVDVDLPDTIQRLRDTLDQVLNDEWNHYLKTEGLNDVVKYLPRQMAKVGVAPDVPQWVLGRVLRTTHRGMKHRKEMLRDLVGGTDMLNDLGMSQFSGWRKAGRSAPHQVGPREIKLGDQFNLVDEVSGESFPARVMQKAAGTTEESFKVGRKFVREDGVEDWLLLDEWMRPEEIRALMPKPRSFGEADWKAIGDDIEDWITDWTQQHGYGPGQRIFEEGQGAQLAKWLADLDPRYAEEGIAVFGTNPMDTILNRLEHGYRAIAASKVLRTTIAENVDDAGTYSVKKLLDQAGLADGAFDDVMRQMDEAGTKYSLHNDDLHIDKDLAEDLLRIMKPVSNPDAVSALGRIADMVTNFWKGSVTSYFPAFHMRNWISGQMQNYLAGAWSMKGMKDVHALLTGKEIRGLAKQAQEFAHMNDKEATEHLADLVFQHKVAGPAQHFMVGSEQFKSSLTQQIPGVDPVTLRKTFAPAPLPGTTRWQRSMPWNVEGVLADVDVFTPGRIAKNVGHYIEGQNRIVPFLEYLKKGVDPAEAAERVRALQVDYERLSSFERAYVRRMIPFFSFAKGMSEYVVRELTQRPGGALAQAVRVQNRLRGTGEEGPLPQYVAETASIPIGTLPDGTQTYLTGLGLMHEDPLALLPFQGGRPDVSKIIAEAISRSNPAVKFPLEIAAGESFFQRGPLGGRELTDMDPTIGRTITNVRETLGMDSGIPEGQYRAPPFIDQNIEHAIANTPLSRLTTTLRVATDPRKREGMWGLKLPLNLMTGLRFSDISPGAQQAILSEELQALMEVSGAKAFENVYFSQSQIDAAPPEQAAEMRRLNAMRALFAQRAKDRALETTALPR